MKFIKALCIISLFLILAVSLQAQCPECPVSIDNSVASYLELEFDPFPPGIDGIVKINVKQNDPRNGVYNAYQVTPTSWGIFNVPASFCCEGLKMDLIIKEKKCLVTANQFGGCGPTAPTTVNGDKCLGFLEHCQEEIEDFVIKNLHKIEDTGCQKWEGVCNTEGSIKRFGKVGIGTSTIPSGFDLAVKNGIVTSAVTVKLCNAGDWCDYVFEEDYVLRPLEEVDSFIDENGHLPGMPSAATLEKEGGFELRAIKISQLEKLEEAYLYTLDVKKRVDELKTKIALLKKENEHLKATR